MKLSKRRIQTFQDFIFLWWEQHKRDLPWRHTHDPYKILVSEVMLQQTQVRRVIPKYAEFIEAYPTANDLARATTADVLRAWKGMGYNRRALYLKRAAEIGREGKLPGVGKYTACAIGVFAYKKNIACVDTNIRRIITHFFFADTPQKESVIQSVADQLLPKGKSWEWHQALMDYGSLELPKIPGIVKKQKKFKNSNRYYRGRIVDLLRNSSVKEAVLLKDFSPSIIDGLLRDGLIVRKNGLLALPQ